MADMSLGDGLAAVAPSLDPACLEALRTSLRAHTVADLVVAHAACPKMVQALLSPKWFSSPDEVSLFITSLSDLLLGGAACSFTSAFDLEIKLNNTSPVGPEPTSTTNPFCEVGSRHLDVVPSGCVGVDAALGGRGFPRGTVVEIAGAAGAGKTQIALTVLATAAIAATSRKTAAKTSPNAVYLVAEDIPGDRLMQIVRAKIASVAATDAARTTTTEEAVLERIAIRKVDGTDDDLLKALHYLEALPAGSLDVVVLDSIAAAVASHQHAGRKQPRDGGDSAAADVMDDRDGSSLSSRLFRVGHQLKAVAVRSDCAVVVLNQIRSSTGAQSSTQRGSAAVARTTRFSTSSIPLEEFAALGLAWSNNITTRLWVERDRLGGGRRVARVLFAPHLAAGRRGGFQITETGAT